MPISHTHSQLKSFIYCRMYCIPKDRTLIPKSGLAKNNYKIRSPNLWEKRNSFYGKKGASRIFSEFGISLKNNLPKICVRQKGVQPVILLEYQCYKIHQNLTCLAGRITRTECPCLSTQVALYTLPVSVSVATSSCNKMYVTFNEHGKSHWKSGQHHHPDSHVQQTKKVP